MNLFIIIDEMYRALWLAVSTFSPFWYWTIAVSNEFFIHPLTTLVGYAALRSSLALLGSSI